MFVGFFFQAEDGIRVWSVTGVQTCALPICQWGEAAAALGKAAESNPVPEYQWAAVEAVRTAGGDPQAIEGVLKQHGAATDQIGRASCRKEWRSRRSPCHETTKRENAGAQKE